MATVHQASVAVARRLVGHPEEGPISGPLNIANNSSKIFAMFVYYFVDSEKHGPHKIRILSHQPRFAWGFHEAQDYCRRNRMQIRQMGYNLIVSQLDIDICFCTKDAV